MPTKANLSHTFTKHNNKCCAMPWCGDEDGQDDYADDPFFPPAQLNKVAPQGISPKLAARKKCKSQDLKGDP